MAKMKLTVLESSKKSKGTLTKFGERKAQGVIVQFVKYFMWTEGKPLKKGSVHDLDVNVEIREGGFKYLTLC